METQPYCNINRTSTTSTMTNVSNSVITSSTEVENIGILENIQNISVVGSSNTISKGKVIILIINNKH